MTSSTTAIAGSVALVTGANRGIGKALTEGLARAGAEKVYAGARNVESLRPLQIALGDRVVPLRLDVTNSGDVANAAKIAHDVNLVFNNAGVANDSTGLGEADLSHAQSEMDVNYFGVLRMMRAFTPVFERQGGGAFVNVASILSMVNFASFGTYSASKAAVWSLSIGLRGLLAGRNIRVVTVHPGPVDTDMAAGIEMEKATPEDVTQAILDGLADGMEEIFPDAMARDLYQQWRADHKAVERANAGVGVVTSQSID